MKTLITPVLLTLSLLSMATRAADTATAIASQHQEEIGLGIGALIGGLLAGPPGIIIGAAGGAWLGDREHREDTQMSQLHEHLDTEQARAADLEQRLAGLQHAFGQQLASSSDGYRPVYLQQLSSGMSLTFYFRTGTAELHPDVNKQILALSGLLSGLLRDFPGTRLDLEGHADARGPVALNRKLSLQRADAIRRVLVESGIDNNRIHTHPYGESRARAAEIDADGHAFDRRVNIILSLDTSA